MNYLEIDNLMETFLMPVKCEFCNSTSLVLNKNLLCVCKDCASLQNSDIFDQLDKTIKNRLFIYDIKQYQEYLQQINIQHINKFLNHRMTRFALKSKKRKRSNLIYSFFQRILTYFKTEYDLNILINKFFDVEKKLIENKIISNSKLYYKSICCLIFYYNFYISKENILEFYHIECGYNENLIRLLFKAKKNNFILFSISNYKKVGPYYDLKKKISFILESVSENLNFNEFDKQEIMKNLFIFDSKPNIILGFNIYRYLKSNNKLHLMRSDSTDVQRVCNQVKCSHSALDRYLSYYNLI
jgi:hypothetical protein